MHTVNLYAGYEKKNEIIYVMFYENHVKKKVMSSKIKFRCRESIK